MVSIPKSWVRELLVDPAFSLTFIVHRVKPNNTLEEHVQFGMRSRVLRYFKERSKHICGAHAFKALIFETVHWVLTDDNILELLNGTVRLVNVIQARNLNKPSDVVRKKLVVDNPSSELVPFVGRSAVYAQPPFTILPARLSMFEERRLDYSCT